MKFQTFSRVIPLGFLPLGALTPGKKERERGEIEKWEHFLSKDNKRQGTNTARG